MDYLELSKEISYALRHAPWEYELELDEKGWVSIEQLLNSLRNKKKWMQIDEEDLQNMIDFSDKKRHEISNGKIRSLYGHSISQRIIKESKVPPEILYHGTARHSICLIRESGLLSKGRQYVHLSSDIDIAFQVGKRHDCKPVILEIRAKQAWDDGKVFYRGNDTVWLTESIPSEYIHIKCRGK